MSATHEVQDVQDWIAIGGQVLDLASSIAGLFGAEDGRAAETSYALGPVVFGVYGGTAGVMTAGDEPVLLTMSAVQNSLGTQMTEATWVRILPGEPTPLVSELTTFAGGTFGLMPMPAADRATLGQAFSFAIRTISVGATIALIGGIQGSFASVPGGYSFTLKSTGPVLQSGTVKVTDVNGVQAEVALNFAAPTDDGTSSTISLPTGLVLSPTVPEVDIYFTLDAASTKALFG